MRAEHQAGKPGPLAFIPRGGVADRLELRLQAGLAHPAEHAFAGGARLRRKEHPGESSWKLGIPRKRVAALHDARGVEHARECTLRLDAEMNPASCVQLAAAIRERRTTCVAAMEAVLERARAVQPRLNCFLRIDADAALAAAHLADKDLARGYLRGPLHGVPMAHKDMYYRRGVVSTCGSKILRATPAAATAKGLEPLDAAGAIQFGVLNMAEFAMGPTGHNWHYGHCRNPWDPERITGGSSSGSGASVAARANFAALGSDTGGSVPLPSSFGGLAGIRPTHGRVSVENILPLCPSLDAVGSRTRTGEHSALML